MAEYNLEETKILLRQVWAIMLMSLYGIGIFQERWVSRQAEAVQSAESILPDVAKVIFFWADLRIISDRYRRNAGR